MSATLFSLQVAFATAIVATTIGRTAALAFFAKSRLPLKGLQSLALGPMIVLHVFWVYRFTWCSHRGEFTGTFAGFWYLRTVLAIPMS